MENTLFKRAPCNLMASAGKSSARKTLDRVHIVKRYTKELGIEAGFKDSQGVFGTLAKSTKATFMITK